MTTNLMQDAAHELNFRSRGREERVARLQAAGVPLDHEGLAKWLATETVKQQEAAGYMFAFDVIRRKTGAAGQELKVDLSLPHTGKVGITIVAAQPTAFLFESEEEGAEEEEAYVGRAWGQLGNAMFCRDSYGFETYEEALENARERMLRDGWFATHAEAVAAGVEALKRDRRVGNPSAIQGA